MSATFVQVFHGEWLKRRRSSASWLVIGAALFTPCVVILARLIRHDGLDRLYADAGFWDLLWRNCWESMALFFLPFGAILITSLVAQIEYRNNAWKQVHALPITDAAVYFSKLLVVLLMLAGLIGLFGLGVWLSAAVPWLLVAGVPYPQADVPIARFVGDSGLYFIDCLPIVAAQFALSLRLRNFMLPIGLGFMAWVGALAALPWEHASAIPYTYTFFNYLKDAPNTKAVIPELNFHGLAIAWFVVITAIGYAAFATRPEKG
jgi:lantibiotic transport system permease protein